MRDEPTNKTSAEAQAASVDGFVATNTSKTLRCMGYSVRETAGAVASLRLKNAATVASAAATDDLASIALAANASKEIWFGPNGVLAEKGITLERLAGSFDIVVYWRAG